MKNFNYRIRGGGALICLLAVLLIAGPAMGDEGPVIDNIIFEGLETVNEKTILGVFEIEEGQGLPADLEEGLRVIYQMGEIETIEIHLEEEDGKHLLVIKVMEKPLIMKVEIKGNRSVGDSDIEEILQGFGIDRDKRYSTAYIGRAIAEIREKYREEGFRSVEIRFETELDKGEVDLVVRIQEGVRLVVFETRFSGISNARPKDMKKFLRSKSKGLLRKGILKEEEFAGDRENLRLYLSSLGHARAKVNNVDLLTFPYRRHKGLLGSIVLYDLYEGPVYLFGDVDIQGNELFTYNELRGEMTVKESNRFNGIYLEQDVARIKSLYAERGYIFSVVSPEQKFAEEEKKVNLGINIFEGPKAHIHHILIRGNTKTKEYVVRRELLLEEGEVFNALRLRRSLERLFNTQYFGNVNVDTRPSDHEGLMDLVIEVEEQRTGLINLGMGFGSGQGGLTVFEQISENNFLGRGYRISERVDYGSDRQNYIISFDDPYFLGTRYSFGLDFFYRLSTVFDRTYDDDGDGFADEDPGLTNRFLLFDYRDQRYGGGIRFGRLIKEYWRLNFSYRLEAIQNFAFNKTDHMTNERDRRNHTPFTPGGKNIFWRNGDNIRSSISVSARYDSRNNVLGPSWGGLFTPSVELTGGPFGGKIGFIRVTQDMSWFWPVGPWKFVASVRYGFGFMWPWGGQFGDASSIPPSFGLDFTGDFDLRGWSTDKSEFWGPVREGRARQFINIEYRFPLRERLAWFSFFLDAGMLKASPSKIQFDPREWKYSFGLGIRVTFPALPINVFLVKEFRHSNEDNSPENEGTGWHFVKPGTKGIRVVFSVGNLF